MPVKRPTKRTTEPPCGFLCDQPLIILSGLLASYDMTRQLLALVPGLWLAQAKFYLTRARAAHRSRENITERESNGVSD